MGSNDSKGRWERKKIKLKRVSLDLDDDLWLTLRVKAAKRRTTIRQIAIEALELWLKKNRH
jgi:hypothetical protein